MKKFSIKKIISLSLILALVITCVPNVDASACYYCAHTDETYYLDGDENKPITALCEWGLNRYYNEYDDVQSLKEGCLETPKTRNTYILGKYYDSGKWGIEISICDFVKKYLDCEDMNHSRFWEYASEERVKEYELAQYGTAEIMRDVEARMTNWFRWQICEKKLPAIKKPYTAKLKAYNKLKKYAKYAKYKGKKSKKAKAKYKNTENIVPLK